MDPRYKAGRYARRKAADKHRPKIPTKLPETEDETESSEAESEDYADVYETFTERLSVQWPEDYWKIKKLAHYLKYGNSTLASLALLFINDCSFDNPITMQALKDNNGINIIINLLDSGNLRLRLASLRCLQKFAHLKMIRYEIVYYGGLHSIVALLWEPVMVLRKAAAEVIATISVFHRAWKVVRSCRGISLLAHLLYLPSITLAHSPEKLTAAESELLETATAAAEALRQLCRDKKNKKHFWKSGGLEVCKKILKCKHSQLLVAVTGLLQECATKKYYRTAIRSIGMLDDIRNNLFTENEYLMQISAQAVFRCAEDYKSREFFGEKGFIKKMYEIISTADYHRNEELMSSMTGALWKCAKSMSNVKRLQSLNAIQLIIQLLATQPLKVQVHIVGCLALCIRMPQVCALARKNGAIEAMVGLLQTTHPPLIKNLNKAIAEASKETESMNIIDKLDAIRLVWSHLQNTDSSVVSNTAWNLCIIMNNIKESVLYIRTLLGGLELVAKQLNSQFTGVLTPICAVVISLTKEAENIAILTDFHVVRLLSAQTTTKCKRLRYFLCMAIAGCCPYKENRKEFGDRGVVKPLIKFLKSKHPEIQGAACHALYQMSMIPKWCAVIHHSERVLDILLKQMDSSDHSVQECAASIIQNIRYFSLVKDKNVPKFIELRLLENSRCIK